MTSSRFPLILPPSELAPRLGDDNLVIVDVDAAESFYQAHIPGAVQLDYADITATRKLATGLLPDIAHLSTVLSRLGIQTDSHVIAYDDEGGGRAGRLLWTLAAIGHKHYSLLDGGIRAWRHDKHPISQEIKEVIKSRYQAIYAEGIVADRDYVLAHLNDKNIALLDTRSPQEYHGEEKLAERVGHIPGAINYNWVLAMDHHNSLRLRPTSELRQEMMDLGITEDKEIIVYCQTHHRSAHTYIMLKALGYPRVRAYPGSWSEWGNLADTPIKHKPVE
ncbi:MAG TPA: sulfurtransferase [Acidiferrobacteraceae bacterium]|nr:sulfurtransferase [Acidiferrobacteraceae bacterium]